MLLREMCRNFIRALTILLVRVKHTNRLQILDKLGVRDGFGGGGSDLRAMNLAGLDIIGNGILHSRVGSRYTATIKVKVMEVKLDLQDFPPAIFISVEPDEGAFTNKL